MPLVTYTTTSVGLSTVACLAVVLAFREYRKKHHTDIKTTLKSMLYMANHFARDEDYKATRKMVLSYILACASAVILMTLCGSLAQSPSLILQLSSIVGTFLGFGIVMMAIGLFIYPSSASEDRNMCDDIVPTLGLSLMGLMAVSYVFDCGLFA
uniref:Uncharacterized protein n=1 Tax=Spumella elongata TaxID=89044 RepID=A0A7S3H3C4_9STRA|mmetsp:Transcript_3309/g.5511  ORF Transcript_3309/g.5511 Transcript_3309/m.5511 type:complete len:154 (+) Transcript_3309:88-549(+)|eukprot:CAMPEP_0184992470 /NCGR_PEP_ID=MMETSP1098-20130426/41372_1 /TAXON_ID=89044 /ORGANISM="Spumella elongata, Strain CCAP 955/1" /LENGTH=153 /DNA_ID=CAMNT_0027518093 /DNA_START=87 /DNA_END=548 /DNA_ORIENTATION=+